MKNILLIITAFFLVALNSFFVAAEFSLVKLRQTRIMAIVKTQGLRGRILSIIHCQLDAYLSACQLGITLASLGLGWIGEPAFANLLYFIFSSFGIMSSEMIHGIALIIAFFTISFLHIVIGELVPKSMAIYGSEKISLWCVIPLYGFYWIMYPLIWMLNFSANWVLNITGLGNIHKHDTHYSSDELKLILRSSREKGKFTPEEWSVLAQSLDFGELNVADLMRPLNEIISLNKTNTLQDNLEIIYQNRFSRYPFFDTSGQEVLGLLHLKDIFIAQQGDKKLKNLDDYLRPVQYISPSMPAIELLRRFRTGSSHFAMIGHKKQRPLGFITLDNLLSMLVGEIRDEFRTNNEWTRQDDGVLLGKGSLPIVTLEHMLGIDLEYDDSVDSVGGLIMEKLGEVPIEGQKITFSAFDIVVKKMMGPKILLVKVYPKIQKEILVE